MLGNIKTVKANRAFTIVELLIVIVVIAILAAISIVAYNGIQSRSRASAAQSSGNIVVKKAESANALTSAYPTAVADFAANQESSLSGSGITLVSSFTPTASNGTLQVLYQKCTTPAASAKYSLKHAVMQLGPSGYPFERFIS